MIDAANSGGWKVRIDRPVCMDRLDIYIYRHVGGYSEIVQPDGKMLRGQDGEYIVNLRPSLSLSGFDGKQMMYALADALAEEGIKGPNDHAIRGQLEAQTAHLNDLRILLKLNKPSGVSK